MFKSENMEKKIKLIWDFYGPDASKTAEHHEIHLKEYIEKHALSLQITGVEQTGEVQFSAFMVVDETEMIAVRDALLPHRGTLYEA